MSDIASKLKADLHWGETPWDDLPREDLLREVQRFYSAMASAHCVLKLMSGDNRSAFCGPGGTGGRALAKAEQVMAPYDDGGDYSEAVFRAFFRYADDLLFNGIGSGWHVCDVCGCMLAAMDKTAPDQCIRCLARGNPGQPMRPVTWDDMRVRGP